MIAQLELIKKEIKEVTKLLIFIEELELHPEAAIVDFMNSTTMPRMELTEDIALGLAELLRNHVTSKVEAINKYSTGLHNDWYNECKRRELGE